MLEIMCFSLLEHGMAFATHFTLQHDDLILSIRGCWILRSRCFITELSQTCKEAESQVYPVSQW